MSNNLLGNGKLTIASRLSSVASAAALVFLVAAIPVLGKEAWALLKEMHADIRELTVNSEIAKHRDNDHERRLGIIETKIFR